MTEASVRRYLYLHSALMFFITSLQGLLIVQVDTKGRDKTRHVNTHLDGFIAALWMAVIAASMDYITLDLAKKRFLAGSAIIFSWAQLLVSAALTVYGVKVEARLTGDFVHDAVVATMLLVMTPSAVAASLLWISGFLPLHPKAESAKKRR